MNLAEQMKQKSIVLLALNFAGAILLCSCATRDSVWPPFPATVAMNDGAGKGAPLILKVRLWSGEGFPLLFDTGCFLTILDSSLTNQLGPRLGTAVGGGQIGRPAEEMGIYAAPKLFLGNVQLATSHRVLVKDTKIMTSRTGVLGILGMDCLKHYCIQLDFDRREIRFLDPEQLNVDGLGEAFPLIMKKCPLNGVLPYLDASWLQQQKVRFWVDSGFFGGGDFMLKPGLYDQAVKAHPPNRFGGHTAFGQPELRIANLPSATFAGNTYRDLLIQEMPDRLMDVSGWMSLQFLGRNQVTFNFPKRVMYLKSSEPSAADK